MKVLATNIYGGGFGVGVRNSPNVDFLGSIETWEPGKVLSSALGIKMLSEVQKADVMIMNPPCSRFSTMSQQCFSDAQRQSLELFPELMGGLDLGKQAGASVIWWENGPVAFTSGRKIIEQAHAHTGAKKTLVLKLDPTHTGAVQLRPRTHVIHFMDDVKIGALMPRQAADVSAYEWIQNYLHHKEYEPAPDLRYYKPENPNGTIAEMNTRKCFNSCKPAEILEHQRYCYAVLSSRQFAWTHLNRWWSIEEYAAAMTFPVIDFKALGLPTHKILPLLSKGLMPRVADHVMSHVITPILNDWEMPGAELKPKEEIDGIYFARMLADHHARDLI